MPYLPTSQAFLEQSAQLLEAYPDTTRITTKYHFPTETPGARSKRAKSQARKASKTGTTDSQPPSTESVTKSQSQAQNTTAPVAALTLKTYNPTTGIVLQYQTNKIAEVSRLITGLGKLASGADVASLGFSATAGAGTAGADVEMVDAPAEEDASGSAVTVGQAGKSQGQGQGQQGQGGKGKKKGGKGKR